MLIKYQTLERLRPNRPVDRLEWIASACAGKSVLDIGCFDETALVKRDTEYWLHGRIARSARQVIGVDSSEKLPRDGLQTGVNARIMRGDGVRVDPSVVGNEDIDVIVAGEFIEHIDSPLTFLRHVKSTFAGRRLVISTPNGVSFANTLLGSFGREVQHPDHLSAFTFKVLNTLCLRAGFEDWEILPYRFFATEMILGSTGAKRAAARTAQAVIRGVEYMFPLLSFGYIVNIRV